MATQVQFRRGTTTDISTFIGADGEVVVDTTKKTCVVHDGIQVAGYPLLREDGSNSALNAGNLSSCALKFINDPNTGIISPGADQIALVTGGASRLSIDSSGSVTIPGNLLVSGSLTGALTLDDGSAAVPALRFTNDPDTGIYLSGTNEVAISTGGTQRLTTTTTEVTSTLPVIHPLGAAATPSLTFAGDTNTGIYSPGADQVAISTNGAESAFFAAGSGRLAAGAIDFNATTFALTGGGATEAVTVTKSGVDIISLGVDGSGSRITSGGDLRFLTNSAERLRITSAGRLGLGTSTPAVTLDVANVHGVNNSITRPFRIRNYGQVSATGYGVGMSFFYPNGTTSDLGFEAAAIDSSYTSGGNFGNLIFSTNNNTGVAERARIDSSGNVGIGTTAPAEKLDVSGVIRATNTDDASFYSTFSNPDGLTRIRAYGGGSSICFDLGTSEKARIDSDGALKTSTNGTYKFGTGTQELTHNGTTSTIHLAASNTSFAGDAATISTYRNTTNDTYKFLACIRQGFAVALEIRDDGDVYNVNGTYGSLSDVKLKENIVDAQSQWDDIKQLRVRNYNFKPETNNSTHKQIGVIAQELETVSPGLVNTVSDRDEDGNDLGTVTKSVNYSVLYMKAVKALQEAMERIEALEAKVKAFESK